jgi:hypothetical protein
MVAAASQTGLATIASPAAATAGQRVMLLIPAAVASQFFKIFARIDFVQINLYQKIKVIDKSSLLIDGVTRIFVLL